MIIVRSRPESGCSTACSCSRSPDVSLPGFNLKLMSCAHISDPPLTILAVLRHGHGEYRG